MSAACCLQPAPRVLVQRYNLSAVCTAAAVVGSASEVCVVLPLLLHAVRPCMTCAACRWMDVNAPLPLVLLERHLCQDVHFLVMEKNEKKKLISPSCGTLAFSVG